MNETIVAILLVFLGFLWALTYLRKKSQSPSKHVENAPRLPPGPYPLPIIGNLHMLGSLPHRSLQKMAEKYGPIMFLRLGNVPTIVISSPYYAKQVLKTHDLIFASRPKVLTLEYMSYGNKAMGGTEYGPYWRDVRKLCTLELLTALKIESFGSMRREEIGAKVESVRRYAAAGDVMDVSAMVAELMEDITCRMIFGKCKDDRFEFKGVIREFMRIVGTFNIADFVPWLGPFDLQGLNRRTKAARKNIDEILETIISEHENNKTEHDNNFIGLLLSLMSDQNNSIGDDSFNINITNVKAILLDMITGSMDTTVTTIQYILLNLMKHPRVMKKLQAELEAVVGLGKMVQEDDLENLLYIDMVTKESLRLYPVTPLIPPHESMEEITINGYLIPKKTRVFVNIWTIGRHPNVWSDNVDDFYPERFESNNVSYRSQDFQLLSFGSGRRGCPAMPLGMKMVQIVVAQLVHCFEWELPKGKSPDEVDMTETYGLAIHPTNTLFAVPTYRLHV